MTTYIFNISSKNIIINSPWVNILKKISQKLVEQFLLNKFSFYWYSTYTSKKNTRRV